MYCRPGNIFKYSIHFIAQKMARTKRKRSNNWLRTLNKRKVNGDLSKALGCALAILNSRDLPPPSKRKKAYELTNIETVIATVDYNGEWYYIVKWENIEAITLMSGNSDPNDEENLSSKNYINATNLFDLPHALVSYEAVRIVIGNLYDIYGDLLCECPFPQVTDNVDGGKWHYIPDYVTKEACLRLHVALVKVWGTRSKPMEPNTPMYMPSIYRVW